ncbi:hypothetical protein CROQUDRAFT_720241 [Cronartium quercuum f. sp. fusiforme G11]|uniref:Uncharacterized protein n=1 Tax=Cronartium quercuum f. sp. fusiforme G11 TaxID=708437 RepID=A0A9P6THG0_9BASI|nr:hypothetical protein CROQUDRAFT_720241 [Cronartium quercuum f. sp. fusiforme G11]
MALLQAVEDTNSEIKNTHDLPANGWGKKNDFLARLMTLNKATHKFLKAVTWKRIAITYFRDNIEEANAESLRVLETLAEQFKHQKHYAKSLNLAINCLPEFDPEVNGYRVIPEIPRIMEVITSIFASAPKDRIREVSICLGLRDDYQENQKDEDMLKAQVDRLMKTIPAFKHLSTFSFLMEDTPLVSETCLGWIIDQLPKLHIIILKGSFSLEKLIQYPIKLAQDLSTRTQLKSLNIRSLNSFTPRWFDFNWEAPLQELTVEITRSNTSFPDRSLLRFCHIFHRTLVSLYFARGDDRCYVTRSEIALAKDFKSLKYLTYTGEANTLWAFGWCPNIECLTWVIRYGDLESAFAKAKKEFHRRKARWPRSKLVNLHQGLRLSRFTLRPCSDLGEHLRRRSVDLGFVPLEEYFWCIQALHDLNSAFYPRPVCLPFQ